MVGFGSSLRLARRPGWEEAYLDYEALKLLMTQIEAIYEEESHLQQHHEGRGRDLDVMFMETPPRRFSSNADQVEPPRRDYRDELFLESDSDAAFEALMKYDFYSAEEEASELEQQHQAEIEHQAAMQMQTQMHSIQHHYLPHQTNNNSPGGKHHHSNSTDSASHVQSIFSERNPQQHQKSDAGTNTATSTLPFSLTSYSRYQELYHIGQYGEGYANRIVDDDEDEDSQDSSHQDLNCVPAAWGSKTKQQKLKQKPPKNKDKLGLQFRPKSGNHSQFLSPGGESDFFVTTGKNTDTFLLDDSAGDNQQDEHGNTNNTVSQDNPSNLQDLDGMSTLTSFSHPTTARNPSSILHKPFRRTLSSEQTTLLVAPSTPATGSALFSFASHSGHVTPPAGESSLRHHHPRSSTTGARLQSASFAAAPNNANGSNPKAAQKKLEEERKQERRRRRQRRRERAAKRKALERKVPRHIRRAHTKARDITERFLGLLRAECEKVMLFAQARLGELADTAGSLRFPAMEDQHLTNAVASSYYRGPINSHTESAPLSPDSAAASRTPASYDYPLSDGGMHSSTSSSSDGAGSDGLFYWSDSSSDDSVQQNDDDSGSPNVPRSLSAYRDLQQGRHDHSKKLDGAKRTPSARNSMRSDRPDKKKHNGFDSAKRHLDHFEKLRRNKPIFQRSGNIMGEDLLLLSAVDEADGYTAVGVELMHVLRFICVNLIAARKICRKHDRLLMNRMLGGYYHHLKLLAAAEGSSTWSGKRLPSGVPQHNAQSFRDEHVQNAQTLGGLLARESADIFEPHHPAVIGQVTNYKLTGLYDANLQQLANSRTVQVISSCLVLALSEYEVSRTRANALATLNSTGSGLPAPRRGSGIRAPSRHKPQLDQMSVLTGPENNAPASLDPFDENDEYGPLESDEEGGPPSTASSISLTRLRFTVTSIIALREAARRKKDMYSTYASRSMLAFTGRAVAGEGLDGCSRETLNFLVSYNPDAALLMDPASLNDGLKQGMWSKRSMGSVMVSSLAVATTPAELPYALSGKTLRQQEKVVISAVNVLPKFKFCEVPDLFKGQRSKKTNTGVSLSEDDSFRFILRLNRASHFLYTVSRIVSIAQRCQWSKLTRCCIPQKR
jgi:SPX domain